MTQRQSEADEFYESLTPGLNADARNVQRQAFAGLLWTKQYYVYDFGGNSNWRGPIWFPLNFLLIESLQKYHHYLGDNFQVECPTGSGKMFNLWDVASELSRRLTSIFLRDAHGRRPVYGGMEKFQKDPHWRNLILFHEYFHGDNGAGLGASHQTGWTALVAKLIQQLHEKPKAE